MNAQSLAEALNALRENAPLVHNITNYVAMNFSANVLLAVGASPIMAHAEEEVEALSEISGALVLNIGTLSPPWIKAMQKAAEKAKECSIPIVLDPVGNGASALRSQVSKSLFEKANVVRGNASEIRAFKELSQTKGVDTGDSVESAIKVASALSIESNKTIVVSGKNDFVVNGSRQCRIQNGHPLMQKVTAMGCSATSLIGAFCSVTRDTWEASSFAMAVCAVCGEIAAERSNGPGTFVPQFIDSLNGLSHSTLEARLRWEIA